MADFQEQIRQYRACLQEWNASYGEYAKSVGLSYTSLSLLSAIYETEQCTQKLLCERCLLPKQTAEAKRLQERHEDHANEERRHRTQNQIAIVMPLITFALGLLVEHFFQIVGFLFSVFH